MLEICPNLDLKTSNHEFLLKDSTVEPNVYYGSNFCSSASFQMQNWLTFSDCNDD